MQIFKRQTATRLANKANSINTLGFLIFASEASIICFSIFLWSEETSSSRIFAYKILKLESQTENLDSKQLNAHGKDV